jgi:predicted  nucleic acid-binding Zn-ribbon protein
MLSNQPEFQNLLLLHSRDRRLQKLKSELEQNPHEQEHIQKQINLEKQSVAIALSEWKELEAKNNALENEIISASDKIARLKQQQLEVKKNEEYTALANEITSVSSSQSLLEDEQLQILLKIDDARETAEIAEGKIALKIADLEKRLTACKEHFHDLKNEISQLEGEVKTAREAVELPILSSYDRTKTVISKPPYIAPIEEQKCSGCNLRVSNDVVSSILVERKLTQCDQCGRIVYVER